MFGDIPIAALATDGPIIDVFGGGGGTPSAQRRNITFIARGFTSFVIDYAQRRAVTVHSTERFATSGTHKRSRPPIVIIIVAEVTYLLARDAGR
jgi:hypothetical protein